MVKQNAEQLRAHFLLIFAHGLSMMDSEILGNFSLFQTNRMARLSAFTTVPVAIGYRIIKLNSN